MTHNEVVSLKEYIERQIHSLETRILDKFASIEHARQIAADVQNERLTRMNEFREQINSERKDYIGRKEVQLMLDRIEEKISNNTCQITQQVGEKKATQEISTKWILILAIAIPTIISLILKFAI